MAGVPAAPGRIAQVGFLGLGQMGGAIAERLLGQPFQLHVYDLEV